MIATGKMMPLLAVLALWGCGTTHLTQPQWVDAMRETYTPGMPMEVVEASVTRAGMTFEEEREVLRRLPLRVVGAGSGDWYRVTKIENTPVCDIQRTLYMRFDEGGGLSMVYPGISRCV